ncbi:hypothetical protein TNCV_3534341 [Trichonephila clavipes]|nr:hypothetical protein TNCV_3534341 [Trichonephila clavipes]
MVPNVVGYLKLSDTGIETNTHHSSRPIQDIKRHRNKGSPHLSTDESQRFSIRLKSVCLVGSSILSKLRLARYLSTKPF